MNWKKQLAGLLCFSLAAMIQVHAQPRGGGGFGGFGGLNRSTANNNNQTSYSPNSSAGVATFQVDPSTGNLIVIGDATALESVAEVIANLDRPKPQVLIKVVFLEVLHKNATDIGVEGNWGKDIGNNKTGTAANVFGLNGLNSLTTNFNAVGPATAIPALTQASPGAGLYQILGTDFQATLRAIAQAGKAQLLSRPSILARDRQPAEIVIGQRVPLITSVNYTTYGNQINGITYSDIGIILRVTPYITSDAMVQMIVEPSTSSLDSTTTVPISVGVNAPVINIRSADTVVITPDGQTVVIGGLMTSDKAQAESKIPILGDIPVLGNLFKRKVNSNDKTELLIFLTPHIVNTPTELAMMSNREQSQSSLMKKSYSEQELDRFLERVPVKQDKK